MFYRLFCLFQYKPNNDDTFNVDVDKIKANKPDDELQALISATEDMVWPMKVLTASQWRLVVKMRNWNLNIHSILICFTIAGRPSTGIVTSLVLNSVKKQILLVKATIMLFLIELPSFFTVLRWRRWWWWWWCIWRYWQ